MYARLRNRARCERERAHLKVLADAGKVDNRLDANCRS